MSVGQLIAILVAICLLLAAVVGSFAWEQLARVSEHAVDLGENALPGVQQALDVRLHVAEYRAAELRVLSEPNNRGAVLADLARARTQVERSLPTLQSLVSTPGEGLAFDAFHKTWTLYVANSENAVGLAQSKQWDDAWTLLTGESQKQAEAMHRALADLSGLKTQAASQGVSAVLDARIRAQRVLVACASTGLLLTAVLAVLLARSITRPLRQALEVAAAVAEGDLACPVAVAGPREIRALLFRLQQMQASLRGLVGGVRSGAEDIQATSEAITHGSHDLSVRTEQQAKHVGEVVSTMGELRETVQSNAAAANEVSAMVVEAADVARRGGAAVQRVVATMSEINEASQRIATIVDLTKDIAFQTDILALNAAVEAARAAGQGRAFAVVAGEVRALAKRSAAAAREIAALIASSVERVDTGAIQVQEAGHTMDEIVSHVERVAGQMRRISESTGAQTDGIAEVGGALAFLDELTKQNSAMVENNRASSAELQRQSENLTRTVAVFRLAA
jgi:methyl-accepting chemotaxis protein